MDTGSPGTRGPAVAGVLQGGTRASGAAHGRMDVVYGFLRSRKWIAGHLLALTGVCVFVWCGLWQLRRLDEVRTSNALVESRLDEPAAPLSEVLADTGGDPEAFAYRRVTTSGTYAQDEEVLLSTRSYQGNPGHHVLTPLVFEGGDAVLVDRGWVPLDLDRPPIAEAAPGAAGQAVTVSGILFPPQEESGFGPRQEGDGEVTFVGRVDVVRIQQQVEQPLAAGYLLALEQAPAPPGELPLPGSPPELDEGSHASYAGQWFLFAGVVVVGYPLLLRRTARDRAEDAERPRVPEDVPAGVA